MAPRLFLYHKNIMRQLFLIFCLTAFIAAGCGDKKEKSESRADEKNVITETDVPAPVKSAFTAKYPGATEIIWEDAKEDDVPTIKVKFKRDNKYWKAEFKGDGTLIKEDEDK